MSEEWIREQLENLKIKDLRVTALNELKNELSTNPSNFSFLHPSLLVKEVFEVAQKDNETEEKNLACDILTMCMSNLNLEHTENNFNDILANFLSHENPAIQQLGINEIERLLRHSVEITDDNTVLLLVKCLQSKETKVGTPSIQVLAKLLPKFIDYNSVKNNLELALQTNDDDIVRCRVYEVAIAVARKSALHLEKTDFILKRAIEDLHSNDVLFQLNVLELLSDLTLESHGLTYIENKGVFTYLIKKIETIEDDPMCSILIPGLMKFFGNVASIHPSKIFKDYPIVINSLFDCLLSEDSRLLKPGYETLGYLASSSDGKIALESSGKVGEILRNIVGSIPNLPSDLKCLALNCLEAVFVVNPENINNQISYICQKWFETITGSANNLTFLMQLCQNPFPDMSLAAFGFLKSLVLHKFGQQAVSQTGGFVEYLLDRSISCTKEIKQEKFDVIQVLSETNVFNAQTVVQLKKYVREGPFYIQGITEIAFEGST